MAWTQGDNGRGMLNYADLVGFAIDDEISNLYVPGRETNLPASAARYATGLALAPTDNFITEFLPDVARRIHFRVVFIQRIVDQVAQTDGLSASRALTTLRDQEATFPAKGGHATCFAVVWLLVIHHHRERCCCVSDPDVPVTVTVDVVECDPSPPLPLLRRRRQRAASVLCTLWPASATAALCGEPSQHTARASVGAGQNGIRSGLTNAAVDGAVTVNLLVTALPEGVTFGGLNEHEAPVGNPEQLKLTAALNPFCGVTVSVSAPCPPADIVITDEDALKVKLAGKLITYAAEAAAYSSSCWPPQ